jgi:hypothetical protein
MPEPQDTTHLVAIHERLCRERRRLAESKQPEERALRSEWVRQNENELAAELARLGVPLDDLPEMSDDELLEELFK